MVNVLFQPGELADLFALRTLYQYLKKERPQFNCLFERGDELEDHLLRHYKGLPCIDGWIEKFKNGVSISSDVYDDSIAADNDLNVDISILKNCAQPMHSEKKAKLRQKYGIFTSKPVLVLSYIAYGHDIKPICELLHAIADSAYVLISGDLTLVDILEYERVFAKQAHWAASSITATVIDSTEKGTLRDYYAMADAAVNCANLAYNHDEHMHNFVEATEGGPLFMVEPNYTAQFGYAELKDLGVLRVSETTSDLIESAANFLHTFESNAAHHRKRTRHLMRARQKYLPFIVDCMDYLFTGSRDCPEELDDLEIDLKETDSGRQMRIEHVETHWK